MTRGVRPVRWLVAVAVLAVVATAGVLYVTHEPDSAMAASSQAVGGEAALAAPGADGAWRSDDETVGAWLQRTWSAPVDVRRVVVAAADEDAGATSGYLRFSDGSQLRVELDGSTTSVAVTPRTVSWMRFTVVDAVDGATSVAVAELDADAGEAPGGAIVEGPPGAGDAAPEADLEAGMAGLVDGDETTDAVVGSSVDLAWDRPRELTRVAIGGAGGDGPTLRAATLEFSDGSTLPVGGVTTDPTRPTVVAFMPRSTTSLRLLVDATSEPGELRLSSLAAYQRGADPAGPAGGSQAAPATGTPTGDEACAADEPRPSDETGLVVQCPFTGTVTAADRIAVEVTVGPSYRGVRIDRWRSGPGRPMRAAVDDTGSAELALDVSGAPVGPFTVAVTATGPDVEDATAFLQLVRPGDPADDADTSGPAGRTLAFEEQFTGDLSANRLGEEADYVAGKPESWGVTDFGEAIFAEPSDGFDNLAQEDGYLRMSVKPRPDDFEDYMGWGREHLGGMIASARQGGSGFSTQYGYFETRMLAPAGPGTWPAFWLLTTPGLVEPQPVSAEIDAVELYGHDPTFACHTSHEYPKPADESEGPGEAICEGRWDSAEESLQWHTYGVDVRPDRIVYYVDGERVADAPQVGATDEPMFWMLDLALGGGYPIELEPLRDRASLYVDWVRVYV